MSYLTEMGSLCVRYVTYQSAKSQKRLCLITNTSKSCVLPIQFGYEFKAAVANCTIFMYCYPYRVHGII